MTVPVSLDQFETVDRVVAEPLRFKAALAIGEDAYATLRMTKHLGTVWDAGGWAATGAAVAATPFVATTFFSSTAAGGLLGWLGLGAAAATPMGWIAAAGLASAGAYFGVTKVIRNYSGSRVDTIPKFINTPLDLLGASLFDLIGGLATRMAWIDGEVSPSERETIAQHFVKDWGLDREYVSHALDVLIAESSERRIIQLAQAVSSFLDKNPDCNSEEVRQRITTLLRDVAEADGPMNEHEELALDAVENAFKESSALSLTKVKEEVAQLASGTSEEIKSGLANLTNRLRK